MLSEGFLSGLYIAFFGFLAGIIAVCYKSKCSHVECCCFKIDRDVATEATEDILELNNASNSVGNRPPTMTV